MSDPLIQLWTQQAQDATALSASELRRTHQRFRRRILIRDMTEYLAGGVVIIAFANIAYHAPLWSMQLACAAVIAGMLVLMRNLWVRRPQDDPIALAHDSHRHFRAQLVAQRDVLASVGRWYLGPLTPGAVGFTAAMFHETWLEAGMATALAASLLGGACLAGVGGAILWLNRRAARTIDREIIALDAAHAPPPPPIV